MNKGDNNDEDVLEDEEEASEEGEAPGWDLSDFGGHDQQDQPDDQAGHEEEMTRVMSMLNSMVHDHHVQDLLWKEMTNETASSREITKLALLELDSIVTLYVGCNPRLMR
jgi:hypothetical protein